MIASDSPLRKIILKEFHSSLHGGHAGVLKTFMKIFPIYLWTGLRKDVRQFVNDCYVCQKIKSLTTKLAGLLQPLPIPEHVWEDLSMDFITGLPSSKGNTVILVVVDRLSKATHFGTLPTSFTANSVAILFANMIIKYHGFPFSIVSNRDSFSLLYCL